MKSFLKIIPLEERIVMDAAAVAAVATTAHYTPSVNSAGFDPHLASAPVIYVNAQATGGNNGTSWANAYHSLQDALNAAAATPGADQIWVAKGTYGVSSANLPDAVAIYGGFVGTESSLLQRDPTLNQTILTGSGLVATNGARDVLSGLTFSGNFSPNGALQMSNGSNVVVADDLFINNTAIFNGGAISSTNSTLDIENSTFSNNRSGLAQGDGGGAIFISNSTLNVENSVFTGNTSLTPPRPPNTLPTNRGGAIDAVGNDTITIDQSSFTNNVAGGGNAINLDSFISSSLVINDSSFVNNHTSPSNLNQLVSGGAIRVVGLSPFASSLVLGINDSVFSNNNIINQSVNFNGNGGAIDIENLSNGQINLTSNTFDQNATILPSNFPLGPNSGMGGAIATINIFNGEMNFNDNTFTANQAFLFGGAIFNGDSQNFIGLSDVQIAYNDNTFDGNKSGTQIQTIGFGDAVVHFFVGGDTTFDSNTFINHTSAPAVDLLSTNSIGTVAFQGNTFEGNLQGAIQASGYASLTSTKDTFIGNQAQIGGALSGSASSITISKDTFIGNMASSSGGAVVLGGGARGF